MKKHERGDNSKCIKRKALILYATHRHDLFYITVKYHQNIPNGFQVIERTRKCLRMDIRTDGWTDRQTDGRQAHRYIPRTFRPRDKKEWDAQSTRCLLPFFQSIRSQKSLS